MPIGGKFPHLLWYQYVPLIGHYLINVKTRGAGVGGCGQPEKNGRGGTKIYLGVGGLSIPQVVVGCYPTSLSPH